MVVFKLRLTTEACRGCGNGTGGSTWIVTQSTNKVAPVTTTFCTSCADKLSIDD